MHCNHKNKQCQPGESARTLLLLPEYSFEKHNFVDALRPLLAFEHKAWFRSSLFSNRRELKEIPRHYQLQTKRESKQIRLKFTTAGLPEYRRTAYRFCAQNEQFLPGNGDQNMIRRFAPRGAKRTSFSKRQPSSIDTTWADC